MIENTFIMYAYCDVTSCIAPSLRPRERRGRQLVTAHLLSKSPLTGARSCTCTSKLAARVREKCRLCIVKRARSTPVITSLPRAAGSSASARARHEPGVQAGAT